MENNNSISGGVWIFGLIVLLAIMSGGLFGGTTNATAQDVNNAQQFGQLLDGNRDIIGQSNANSNNIVRAIDQSEYETVASMKDAQLQLQDRLSDLHVAQSNNLARMNELFGNTRMEIADKTANLGQGIMQNRYEGALRANAITDAIMLDGQKTRDLITSNRMDDMRQTINKLELEKVTCGMLKFPMNWTYPFPLPFQPFTPPTTSTGTTG